jgi:predicted DNA-binding protein
MKGKRRLTSLYIEPEVHAALRQLSAQTRVPQAVYLREAVADLLDKYHVKVTPQKVKR